MFPRVVPVLDLKAGRVVHAIGGDRAHYRPIASRLHPGSDPIPLARALRETFGFEELYLADLDAIAGAATRLDIYEDLHSLGLSLWVDAGVRDAGSLGPIRSLATVVAGLETIRGPAALAAVVSEAGPERVVFSLDLRGGRPIVAEGAEWGTSDPRALAESALRAGVRRLLLLDLARVGTGRGVGTLGLVSELRKAHPGLEIAVGGGVASVADLPPLGEAGASAVLVGSALHDGRISKADLDGRASRDDGPPRSTRRSRQGDGPVA